MKNLLLILAFALTGVTASADTKKTDTSTQPGLGEEAKKIEICKKGNDGHIGSALQKAKQQAVVPAGGQDAEKKEDAAK